MVHPLKPSDGANVAAASRCLADAERRKHLKYDDGCTATGWQFIPFAVSTFGTLGHEAEGLVAMMASYMGSLQLISDDEPDLLRQFKERISVAAMKAVGKQLFRVFILDSLCSCDHSEVFLGGYASADTALVEEINF